MEKEIFEMPAPEEFYPTAKVGKLAPDFTLDAFYKDEFIKISLKDYRGKWVVFFFWPLDFTFVCPTEVTAFSDAIGEFEKENAVVLGCSVDSKHAHRAWSKEIGPIAYPLLSDLTKEVCNNYGVLIEEEGIALRGLFIIDPDGILRYEVVHDLNVGRSVEEVLRVLAALKSGGLCAVNWKKGDQNLKA